jgi:SAM-dependent methyltransferase
MTLLAVEARRSPMNAIRSDELIPVTKQRPPLDLEEAEGFWVREADRWDGTSGRFGDAMLEADLEPVQRVLDVGCGAGSTRIESARRVAPKGAAVGVDIPGPALARAGSVLSPPAWTASA